jgi:ligand-binding sensor domain-containing protein
MRRSIYLLLTLLLTLVVILPVKADHRMLDQQGRKQSTALQGGESAWIVWETQSPVQRLGVDGNDLWVGTYGGGLQRWDREIGYQESFSSGAGLPGSDVSGIARDGSGNLWVTLLDGRVVRSSDGSAFSNITPPAPADENAWTVAARGSDIWVGTLGGGLAKRSGGWTLFPGWGRSAMALLPTRAVPGYPMTRRS